jgi:hypothetical protein
MPDLGLPKHSNQRLTPKQEDFCQQYLLLKSASAAYRESYDATRSKPETVHVRASELLKNSKVAARIDELRAEVAPFVPITIDEVAAGLRAAAEGALGKGQFAAASQALMGLGKLGGIIEEKQRVTTVDEGQAHLDALRELVDRRAQKTADLKVVNG